MIQMNSISNNSNLPYQISNILSDVCGASAAPLHKPTFSGNEWEYTKDCIETTFVSSVGKYVDRFENDLESFTGARKAVAVVNGTSALHIALILAGVRQKDEVLIPALTFVATANAVKYCGAIPHLIDSNESTLGVDPDSLFNWLQENTEQNNGLCINKNTKNTIRAIVPMHTFGHPCAIDELINIARKFNLILVEDAAESLGSFYKGQHTGTFGELGVLSFNGNKTITTGGGGAILTDNLELAAKAKHLTTTAKMSHSWEYNHDAVGFNYRLPNLNAALGCAQLEQIESFIKSKRRLYCVYEDSFSKVKNVRLMKEPKNCKSNYWLHTLILDKSVEDDRDAVLQMTNDRGYMTRPSWTLMHYLKQFSDCPRAPLPVAESLAKRLINIPSSAGIV